MQWFSDKLRTRKTVRDIKLNCRILPINNSQLIQVYDQYLKMELITDEDKQILIAVRKQNNRLILGEFQSLLDTIISMLNSSSIAINKSKDLQILDVLIDRQIPQKFLSEDKITPSSLQNPIDFPVQKFKSGDVLLSYLFSKFTQILTLVVHYYHVKDNSELSKFNSLIIKTLQGHKKNLQSNFINSVSSLIFKSQKNNSVFEFQDEKKTTLEQKTIKQMSNTVMKSSLRHQIEIESGLSETNFQIVQHLIFQLKQIKNYWKLKNLFSKQQKAKITLILEKSLTIDCDWLIRDTEKLQLFLNEFNENDSKSQQKQGQNSFKFTEFSKMFQFVVMLYFSFEETYSPSSRRLLLHICHVIELEFNEQLTTKNGSVCLVHVLKMLQSYNIRPVKQNEFQQTVYDIITNQEVFKQSLIPLNQKNRHYDQKYRNQAKTQFEVAQHLLNKQLEKLSINQKQVPRMKLLKLTNSKYRKNATILISGFMEEDKDKFAEWMGVLESVYDSEIYALVWSSSNIETMISFCAKAGREVLYDFTKWMGLFKKEESIVTEKRENKFEINPFSQCFEKAQVTGKIFADLLIKVFDGHFINLIGFSLGTQLILSSLQKFKQREKLHMINRIITMGGVADKHGVYEHMRTTQQSTANPVCILWTNLYCETDHVLKFVLPLTKPYIQPIGLSVIPEIKSKQQLYKVQNISVAKHIEGHLSYRNNIKVIARLLGLKDF